MDDRDGDVVADLQRRVDALLARVAALEAENQSLRRQLSQSQARVHELERELARRGRKHRGTTRPAPKQEPTRCEEVRLERCPCCAGTVEPTGRIDERLVEDIPEPKPEIICYRRHHYWCNHCHRSVAGRADLDIPGSRLGPRVRLLAAFGRVGLGCSLEKTQRLLEEFYGLPVSRAGLLGALRWTADLFRPVVHELLEQLRQSPVVFADETSWPHDGKFVWCWVLANPGLAVFLIDHHRDRETFRRILGDSFTGTLVTDFYAVYHGMAPRQQRCLAHLMVTLKELSERLPKLVVTLNIDPLIEFLQAAFAFARTRAALTARAAARRRRQLERSFADILTWHSKNPDCKRIFDRLRRHRDEILTFLDDKNVPPDNNGAERPLRGVAADRGNGGGTRAWWGTRVYADLKSVLTTCRKQGINFFRYGLDAIRRTLAGLPPPLPINHHA